jgi:Rrf2 family protein
VDLTLSKTADYTVRAAIALGLAWRRDGYETIQEVSDEMELPRTFTPQILGKLARAGIAESKAGRGGGYRLCRAPEQITLLEIVEASEGRLEAARCTLRGGPCRWDDMCAVHPYWSKVSEAVRDVLARTSLADIVQADLDLAAGKRIGELPATGHRVHAH